MVSAPGGMEPGKATSQRLGAAMDTPAICRHSATITSNSCGSTFINHNLTFPQKLTRRYGYSFLMFACEDTSNPRWRSERLSKAGYFGLGRYEHQSRLFRQQTRDMLTGLSCGRPRMPTTGAIRRGSKAAGSLKTRQTGSTLTFVRMLLLEP